jgi:hypothetical protein
LSKSRSKLRFVNLPFKKKISRKSGKPGAGDSHDDQGDVEPRNEGEAAGGEVGKRSSLLEDSSTVRQRVKSLKPSTSG